MPTVREVTLALLALLTLEACRIRRLPELPPERDPTAANAPATPYAAPADLLTGAIEGPTGAPAARADEPHHHGHHHHGGAR